MTATTIVSVNAGRPRTIVWRGREITTSIFKSPIEGSVPVRGINVAGDEQADREVHGGPEMAVYAYAEEDYAWWATQLGKTLAPGTFGENLTLRGVDVGGALIGERWRVGSALLEVASPRVPCYKLGMRMDDPAFVKRFGDALRPGAYLRIVEEGTVAAGDGIALVERPQRGISIARVADIYLHDRAAAREMLPIERLPESWRAWASNAVEHAG